MPQSATPIIEYLFDYAISFFSIISMPFSFSSIIFIFIYFSPLRIFAFHQRQTAISFGASRFSAADSR
jgi:hypothetical protein